MLSSELFILIGIILIGMVTFMFFSSTYEPTTIEGMTNQKGKKPNYGGAGKSQTYADQIKAETVRLQDTLLISKYKANYETVLLNLDDYFNHLMLKHAVSIDFNNPEPSIRQLSALKGSKDALNNVMKFLDDVK